MASAALARRDEPTNIDDQFRLLDVHLSNLTATVRASRIRLGALWSCYAALERQARERSRLNKSYAAYVEELQGIQRDVIGQLRQSRSRAFRLQAELRSEKATLRRSGQRRQRRNDERRKSC